MRLPADTVIAEVKLTRYLLLSQARGDKSAFLAKAGYTLGNAGQLQRDLRTQILPLDAMALESNKFGKFYEIRDTLVGPNGRDAGRSHHLDDRALGGRHEVHYTYSRQAGT